MPSTGTFKATYNAWGESTSPSFSLSNYNPYAFPFDTYQTPEIIIAFSNIGSKETAGFYIDSWNLTANVPSGFSATLTDPKMLTQEDFLSKLGNNTSLGNSAAFSFKITMLHDNQSLLLLSIYAFVPLLGIWCIFAVTQFLIDLPKIE